MTRIAGLSPFTVQPGGGVAFDVGIYYVTALLSILGPVHSVTGIMETRKKNRPYQHIEYVDETFTILCENIMSGTMEFANGAIGNLLFDPNLFGGEVKVILKGNQTPFVMQQAHPFSKEYRGLGAAELAWSIRRGRKHRAGKEMALHALEVLEGINRSGQTRKHYTMTTTFQRPEPLARGYMDGDHFKGMEETVLSI